jgi:hypothetical protein
METGSGVSLFCNIEYFLDPTNLPALETNLYTMRMKRGLCKDIFDDTASPLSRALVSFQYHIHLYTRADIFAVLSIHSKPDLNKERCSAAY